MCVHAGEKVVQFSCMISCEEFNQSCSRVWNKQPNTTSRPRWCPKYKWFQWCRWSSMRRQANKCLTCMGLQLNWITHLWSFFYCPTQATAACAAPISDQDDCFLGYFTSQLPSIHCTIPFVHLRVSSSMRACKWCTVRQRSVNISKSGATGRGHNGADADAHVLLQQQSGSISSDNDDDGQ